MASDMEIVSMTVAVPLHEVNFIFSHPDNSTADWHQTENTCYEEFTEHMLTVEGIDSVDAYQAFIFNEMFYLYVTASTVEEALAVVRGGIASWNAAFDPFRYDFRAYRLRNGQDPDVA